METRDSLNAASNNPDELKKAFKETLDKLAPITDSAEAMEMVRQFIMHAPKEDQMQCEQVISVFLRMFSNMLKSIKGETISKSEVETLFMSESLMLDLNNNWYRKMKPIIEPVIAESKVSMMTALVLIDRDDSIKHESDDKIIWSLLISSWDFIPWIIFACTANMQAYISSKEMFRRMIIISESHFGIK